MLRNKSITCLIAVILMLTITITMINLPISNAEITKETYPFIGAMPNPVGVGQEVLIHLGISDPTVWPQPGWEGLTVTVTKPDGKQETLGPFATDTTGGTGTVYVPTMTGTYYLQTNFPEQIMQYERSGRTFPAGTIMEASNSNNLTLTVNEDPVKYYPNAPLPSEYWSRPINSQLREWSTISGSWFATPNNRFAPYNDGPEAPHILWTKPLAEGGLAGGDLGVNGYETGDAYEGKFSGSVIINGVLYFNRQISQSMMSAFDSTAVEQQVVAWDIKTGEELWSKVLGENERLSFGQTMYWQTMNMYGAFSYLWTTVGSTWNAYDPLTGRWEFSINNVPSGSRVYGPNGEILIYTVNTANAWMTQWNSTTVVYKTYFDYYMSRPQDAANAKYYSERWRPYGIEFSASAGYDWNVTIPTDLPGSPSAYFPEDRIIGSAIARGDPTNPPITNWGISLKPGQKGQLLFKTTWQPPAGDLELSFGTANLEDGVFVIRAKELRAFFGFSIDDGQLLWGPTESRPYMDLFMGGPSGERGILAYGKLYIGTLGGVLQCYDTKTGTQLWKYETTSYYPELVWGQGNWPIEFGFVTDGKVYLLHSEHSGNSPLPRGAPFVCLNATTGEEIFRVDGAFRATTWGGDPMIADSTMIMFNTYDNRIYSIGKGPSAMTVSAPDLSGQIGQSITIKGTITDVSAGTEDNIIKSRFPNGVPAVSDESMGEWMKYVYMQFPRPTNTTGLPIIISVVDANGNYRDIGTTTSDADGFFAFTWKPDIEGQYIVYASFAGSESYWPSHAVTAFNVDPAASTSAPTEQAIKSASDMYFIPAVAGIIVAIAIGFAVTILMLRRRP